MKKRPPTAQGFAGQAGLGVWARGRPERGPCGGWAERQSLRPGNHTLTHLQHRAVNTLPRLVHRHKHTPTHLQSV